MGVENRGVGSLSLFLLNIARSSLFSPTCSGILLLLFDIVGADEEDVAEEEEMSFCVGEFVFLAAEYSG